MKLALTRGENSLLNVENLAEKMKKWPYCLSINVILAIGVFLCALLGRSMGIQGPALAISVVWPATGLSLAGLLLFGFRAGFGVFLGNFAYNFLFFYAHMPIYMYSAIFIITLGSFLQAMMSAYIMRTYCSPLYFRTVQDIFVFLIPATLFSCLIGSVAGVFALKISGELKEHLTFLSWFTFWLGDSVGIYVVTPLIMVWALQKSPKFSNHIPSIICMTFLFLGLSFVTYYFDYPLPHLFVPISIWAAYLLRMHGASLTIFLMTAASLTFATLHGFEGTSLISLITFIAVTVAASLIIASVVNERAIAFSLLDSRNVYLEQEVDMKIEILEHVKIEASKNHKFQSSREVNSSLEKITGSSFKALTEMRKLLSKQESMNIDEKMQFIEHLNQIDKNLKKISSLFRQLLSK